MIPPPSSGWCLPLVCPSQILDAGSGLAGSVASAAASTVLHAVGDGLAQAATWVVGQLLDLIGRSTTPDMGAGWFGDQLALMKPVVLAAILPVLLAASVGPVLRQDGRRLFRVWGVGLPVAVLAGLVASQLAWWGLAWTDALSSLVAGRDSMALASQFTAAMTGPAASGAPLFVQMIIASLTLTGALLVWLELILRSAAVYVTVFFMPIVLVAFVWPATSKLAKRGVEVLTSIILSKFVIVASLSLGSAALAHGGVDASLAGAAVLLLAAFAPFALFRLAPVVEAGAIAHLEGMSRRPVRAAGRTATAVAGAPGHPITQLVMSAASTRPAEGGLVARPVTSSPLPMATPDYVPGDRGGGSSSAGRDTGGTTRPSGSTGSYNSRESRPDTSRSEGIVG